MPPQAVSAGELVVDFVGTIDTADATAYPGVMPGDTFEATYTIVFDPLADTDPAADAGRWVGDVTLLLTVEGAIIADIDAPGVLIARDNFLGFNDLLKFNANDPATDPNAKVYSLNLLDTTQTILTGDDAPTPNVINAFPNGPFPLELEITAISGGPILMSGVTTFHRATCACGADQDGNGVFNLDDLDAFVSAFLAGELDADLDCNHALNLDDIDLFVSSFLSVCR